MKSRYWGKKRIVNCLFKNEWMEGEQEQEEKEMAIVVLKLQNNGSRRRVWSTVDYTHE